MGTTGFMAKKKAARKKPGPKPGSTRTRRSAQERLDALKQQIASIEAREKAKELREDPTAQYAIKVARELNRGAKLAVASKDSALQHAVADAHEAIGGYLTDKGLKIPKPRRPRGRRPGK